MGSTEHRRRIVGVVAGLLVLAVAAAFGAFQLLSSSGDARADDAASRRGPTPSTTTAPTTSTTGAGGLVQPPDADLPALPPGGLGPGASGPVVQAYQERLAALHVDPGAIDGAYGGDMTYAVDAVQKLLGLPVTGTIGDAERSALMRFRYPAPLQPDGEADRTEIDVTKQVLVLYEDHQVRLVTTTSTGSGARYCYDTPRDDPTRHVCEAANTPSGRFTFREYRDGWDRSPLGRLYNPFYFNGGIAVHGYPEVPTTPASHGCARIPMHVADSFHTLVHVGDPVYVFGGTPADVYSSTPIETTTTTTLPPPPPETAPVAVPTVPSSTTSSSTSSTSTTTSTTTP